MLRTMQNKVRPDHRNPRRTEQVVVSAVHTKSVLNTDSVRTSTAVLVRNVTTYIGGTDLCVSYQDLQLIS